MFLRAAYGTEDTETKERFGTTSCVDAMVVSRKAEQKIVACCEIRSMWPKGTG